MDASGWLVDTEWLSSNLNKPDIRILDATWYMPGQPEDAFEQFKTNRIPGTQFFDIDEVSDTSIDLPHMLPSEDVFAKAVSHMGIGNKTHVIVYDRVGIFSSPRVWWTFRTMGHDRVSVLNGGLKKWIADGYTLETSLPSNPSVNTFQANLQSNLVSSFDDVLEVVNSGNGTICDVRPNGRFQGIDEEPRPVAKKGHMPGARNLFFGDLVNEDGTLKSIAELAEIVSCHNIEGNTKIITTCGSGITAAILFLVFSLLDMKNISLYDGSWADWGARQEAPIELTTKIAT